MILCICIRVFMYVLRFFCELEILIIYSSNLSIKSSQMIRDIEMVVQHVWKSQSFKAESAGEPSDSKSNCRSSFCAFKKMNFSIALSHS